MNTIYGARPMPRHPRTTPAHPMQRIRNPVAGASPEPRGGPTPRGRACFRRLSRLTRHARRAAAGLLVLLGVALAAGAPAHAQTETEIWSATMTVGVGLTYIGTPTSAEIVDAVGFEDSLSTPMPTLGALTPNSFSYGGGTIRFTWILLTDRLLRIRNFGPREERFFPYGFPSGAGYVLYLNGVPFSLPNFATRNHDDLVHDFAGLDVPTPVWTAGQTVSVRLVEVLPRPTVTIAPKTMPVTDGTAAEYAVRLSSAAPRGGLTVTVSVADAAGSDFVAPGDEGVKTVSVAPLETEATFRVPTTADSTPEPDGAVTVTVQAGTGYAVGNPTSASITIRDFDDPSTDLAPTVTDSGNVFRRHVATAGRPFRLELPAADSGSGNGGPYEYILLKRNTYSLQGGVLWLRWINTREHFQENGLSFDPVTRVLSGTPQEQAVHFLAYEVHDRDGNRSRADSFVEQTNLRIHVVELGYPDTAARAANPAHCVEALGTLSASAGPVTLTGQTWQARECYAHHRRTSRGMLGDDRQARYFSFTLTESAKVSVALNSRRPASLFVSKGTPANGWGSTPKGWELNAKSALQSMKGRLATRSANGKLVHVEAHHANLALEPGNYTVEVVLEEGGYDPVSTFGLRIEVAGSTTVQETDTPPTVSDIAAFANHEATVGEAFSLTLPAADEGSGNGGPYGYAIYRRGQDASFAHGLDGLVFDPVTRTLSGTPEREGVYALTYVVHDGDANRSLADSFVEASALQITVAAPAPTDPDPQPQPQPDPPPSLPPAPLLLQGTAGDDELVGQGGDDELAGRQGHDTLRGAGGHDLLKGGGGNDTLDGGAGDDELRGWQGDDTYTGGPGADRFVFSPWESGDKIITDFGTGDDVIVLAVDLSADPWPSVADILASVVAQGSQHTVYTLRPGLTVETDTPLSSGDFVEE